MQQPALSAPARRSSFRHTAGMPDAHPAPAPEHPQRRTSTRQSMSVSLPGPAAGGGASAAGAELQQEHLPGPAPASAEAEEVTVDTLTQQLDFNKACVAEVYALQRSIATLSEAKDEAAMDGTTQTKILVQLTLVTSQLYRISERLSKTLQALGAHNLNIIKTNVKLKEDYALLLSGDASILERVTSLSKNQVSSLVGIKSSIMASQRPSLISMMTPIVPAGQQQPHAGDHRHGAAGAPASLLPMSIPKLINPKQAAAQRSATKASVTEGSSSSPAGASVVDREHQFPAPADMGILSEEARNELRPEALSSEITPAAHIDFQFLKIHDKADMDENDLFRCGRRRRAPAPLPRRARTHTRALAPAACRGA